MGMGTSGIVYSYPKPNGKNYAIKFIGNTTLEQEGAKDDFEVEVSTQRALASIGVAPAVYAHGYLTDNGVKYRVWKTARDDDGRLFYHAKGKESVYDKPADFDTNLRPATHAFMVMDSFEQNLRDYLIPPKHNPDSPDSSVVTRIPVETLQLLESKLLKVLWKYIQYTWCMDIKGENMVLDPASFTIRMIDFDPFYCHSKKELRQKIEKAGYTATPDVLDKMMLFVHMYLLCTDFMKDGMVFMLQPLMHIYAKYVKPRINVFACLRQQENTGGFSVNQAFCHYVHENQAFTFFKTVSEVAKTRGTTAGYLTDEEKTYVLKQAEKVKPQPQSQKKKTRKGWGCQVM